MGGGESYIEIININTNSYSLSQIPLNSNYVVIWQMNYKILSNNLEIISDIQKCI
jgi:hypothetical protein